MEIETFVWSGIAIFFCGEDVFRGNISKKIYPNTLKYRRSLFQKDYEYEANIYSTEQLKGQKIILYESETNPYALNHGLQKELKT